MSTVCRKIEYGSPEFAEAARFRFQVCCVELGWFDSSNYPNQQETDGYDPFAEHIGIYDDEKMAGYIRLINSEAGNFPIQNYIVTPPEFEFHLCCEVSRLITDQLHRKTKVGTILIMEICDALAKSGCQFAFSLIEPQLLRRLNSVGVPLKQFGEPILNHLGATKLLPCVVRISDIHLRILEVV